MSSPLPPVPHQAPLADDGGIAAPVWADWFKQVAARVGGHLGKTDDFLSSHATNGHQRLPGGLVIQWGQTASLASGSSTTITFPTAFKTACLHVLVSIKDNSGAAVTATGQPGTGNYLKTGFDLYNRTSIALTFNWLAVGY